MRGRVREGGSTTKRPGHQPVFPVPILGGGPGGEGIRKHSPIGDARPITAHSDKFRPSAGCASPKTDPTGEGLSESYFQHLAPLLLYRDAGGGGFGFYGVEVHGTMFVTYFVSELGGCSQLFDLCVDLDALDVMAVEGVDNALRETNGA